MAKTAKFKGRQHAPESSLERARQETKLRLQRNVRREKQIAALARQLTRLCDRNDGELTRLAQAIVGPDFKIVPVSSGAAREEDDRVAASL